MGGTRKGRRPAAGRKPFKPQPRSRALTGRGPRRGTIARATEGGMPPPAPSAAVAAKQAPRRGGPSRLAATKSGRLPSPGLWDRAHPEPGGRELLPPPETARNLPAPPRATNHRIYLLPRTVLLPQPPRTTPSHYPPPATTTKPRSPPESPPKKRSLTHHDAPTLNLLLPLRPDLSSQISSPLPPYSIIHPHLRSIAKIHLVLIRQPPLSTSPAFKRSRK